MPLPWSIFPALILVTLHASVAFGASPPPKVEFKDGALTQFITRPDIRANIWKIKIRNDTKEKLAPGYFWTTPYDGDWKKAAYGPSMYTDEGELIWDGNEGVEVRAMDGHACDYMGGKKTHVCYNDAAPIEQMGHSAGVIRFFDNTYNQAGWDYGRGSWMREPDIHELNSVDDGYAFIQDIFQKRLVNLTDYLGPEVGYIADGCFQEVNMKTQGINFEWCASDHIELWDTYIYLRDTNSKNYTHSIAGNGAWAYPWDYFHINAIDKNFEGDYVVSGRHLDTIFKIAGKETKSGRKPGDIIWRLGGKRNSFTMMDTLHFGRQHHVRFISTGYEEEVISLFDNADDGQPPSVTAPHSAGKFIKLNNHTMEAHLVKAYIDPDGARSNSQGSVQTLDNGHIVIGWGNRPQITEFAEDGTVLWHGRFSAAVNSFRSYKFPWVGNPSKPPDIVAYSKGCRSRLYGYASWNGATEVHAWKWFGSSSSSRGPWHFLGTYPKDGFETFIDFSKAVQKGQPRITFLPYVFAQALDEHGQVLRASKVVKTYTPNEKTAEHCHDAYCDFDREFHYDTESGWDKCAPLLQSNMAGILLGLIILAAWELWTWYMNRFGWEVLAMGVNSDGDGASADQGASFLPLNERDGFDKLRSGPDSPHRWVDGKQVTEYPMVASGVQI